MSNIVSKAKMRSTESGSKLFVRKEDILSRRLV